MARGEKGYEHIVDLTDTTPPPPGGDAYAAETVVRGAPAELANTLAIERAIARAKQQAATSDVAPARSRAAEVIAPSPPRVPSIALDGAPDSPLGAPPSSARPSPAPAPPTSSAGATSPAGSAAPAAGPAPHAPQVPPPFMHGAAGQSSPGPWGPPSTLPVSPGPPVMPPPHAAQPETRPLGHPAPMAPAQGGRRRLLIVLVAFGATALLAAMLTLYLFAE
jgi:hypothetical protein